jgi:hypothetical protein
MSSPTQTNSTSPVSSDNADLLGTSQIELSRMILQTDMPQRLTDAFTGRPTPLALLREYYFVSRGIDNLRREMERHRTERASIYAVLMSRHEFQETISPVLNEYRQRHLETDLPPYEGSPPSFPTDTPRLPRLSPTLSESHSSHPSSTPDSPQTVEVLSEEPMNEEDTSPSEDSIVSFYAADTSEPGTQENPIDIDLIPAANDTPPPHIERVRRTRSAPIPMYCNVCMKFGHPSANCVRLGPIVCAYCREIGHVKSDCITLRREIRQYNPDMQFCMVCAEPGHSVNNCATLFGTRSLPSLQITHIGQRQSATASGSV